MEKIQLKNNIIELNSPIDEDILSKLKIGDIVYINGKIITARDQAHKRIVEEGSPIDLNGMAIFHAGPIIKVLDEAISVNNANNNINNNANNNINNNINNNTKTNINNDIKTNTKNNINKTDLNNYRMVAIGPTTSMRMNPYESDVLDMGAKIIIGKGGMDEKTVEALKRNQAVYLVATGGCAALYVSSIKEISGVDWLDLGIPEAIWHLDVDKFGPLIVASDSHGNNIFSK